MRGLVTEAPEVFSADIGHLVLFQMSPDVLHWIEFGSVSGEPLSQDMSVQTSDVVAHKLAAMRWQTIPNDQQFAGYRPHQVFEKQHDVRRLDGFSKEFKVEIPDGEASNERQRLPVEMMEQDRCLPSRSPGTAAMRSLAQSAFVDQDDCAVLLTGFFLRRGQVFFFHSWIATSSRSSARPVGRCGDQPSCRRMRQT